MKVIYGIGDLTRTNSSKKVVTVGVFDGVHRGHQWILRKVVREARRRHLLSAVVTFSRHPSTYFHPKFKTPELTSLEHKLLFIEGEGIDLAYAPSFNKAFAKLEPEDFIRDILLDKIGMVSLYVGEDFVFGRRRKGDKRMLLRLSKKYRFRLHVLKHLKIKKRIVSSTRIRRLIRSGRLDKASSLLDRPVSSFGRVIRGEGRGRTLGFPTANIKPDQEVLVPDGVYAVQAHCRGHLYRGAAYLGTKPTFKKIVKARSIEVFLFGLKNGLYGQRIEVRFIKKIRDSQKFPSRDDLIGQIKEDIVTARKILESLPRA